MCGLQWEFASNLTIGSCIRSETHILPEPQIGRSCQASVLAFRFDTEYPLVNVRLDEQYPDPTVVYLCSPKLTKHQRRVLLPSGEGRPREARARQGEASRKGRMRAKIDAFFNPHP